MPAALDITGHRYTRLVALRRVGPIHRDSLWLFRCDCGVEKQIVLGKVRSGLTRSCGCLSKEVRPTCHYAHGESNAGGNTKETRLYRIWGGMKQRCGDEKNYQYSRYGGRGINVCEEWLVDYVAFRDWAMSHGYSDALSIDRIDNDAGYSAANCRWATPKEQAANRGGKFARK